MWLISHPFLSSFFFLPLGNREWIWRATNCRGTRRERLQLQVNKMCNTCLRFESLHVNINLAVRWFLELISTNHNRTLLCEKHRVECRNSETLQNIEPKSSLNYDRMQRTKETKTVSACVNQINHFDWPILIFLLRLGCACVDGKLSISQFTHIRWNFNSIFSNFNLSFLRVFDGFSKPNQDRKKSSYCENITDENLFLFFFRHLFLACFALNTFIRKSRNW